MTRVAGFGGTSGIAITCSRCGAPPQGSTLMVYLEYRDWRTGKMVNPNMRPPVELCRPCLDLLDAWLLPPDK